MSNTPKWLAVGALTIVVVTGIAAVATQHRDNRVSLGIPTAPQTLITEPTTTTTALEPALTEVAATPAPIPNELIDYPEFKRVVNEAEAERESKRLTEAEFLAAMAEPTSVLLDVRSPGAFAQWHLRGAVNLPLTDWTVETLAQTIPSKDTKVLIYCNNNFTDAILRKIPPQALNLLSYTSLMAHGYTNIYELGPALKVSATALPIVGTWQWVVPGNDVPGNDGPRADAPHADVPHTDVPHTDVPHTDVPGAEAPTTEVPTTVG
jgi:phage shock protein E